MKIIDPTFEFVLPPTREDAYGKMAAAMRNCYRAELNATPKTDEEMIEKAIRLRHLTIIEHESVTVNIVCDRGVTHELVRHRLCSFAQESTRYCNYAGDKFGREITVVRPSWAGPDPVPQDVAKRYNAWLTAMRAAESAYMDMLDAGATSQEARAVLPNSLAATIAVTANMREWVHIFRMRCDLPAHPDMRAIMKPILLAMLDRYPVIFQPVHNWLTSKGAMK